MSALVASLVTGIVTAVLAALGTYVTTRRNLQIQFDASLRELRIAAYKALWKELEDLAKYGRAEPLSRSQAQQLSISLRTWYFETGGLFLSQETRRDYFALLDGLEVVPRRTNEQILSEEDDEFLRVLGSRLRTAMTRDVGTRRTFIFRGDTDRAKRVSQAHTYAHEGGDRHLRISPRWWQRLPGVGALLPGQPQLDVEGARWDPSRRAFSARVSDSPQRVPEEERVFLMEDRQVVEGPSGWQRGDTRSRGKSVVWHEIGSGPQQKRETGR
jgi:hypothetical protein